MNLLYGEVAINLVFVCVVAIEVEIEIFQDVYWERE